MDQYSLGLYLLDFLPNLAFLAGGGFLVQLATHKGGRFDRLWMICGVLLVFFGGLSKAIGKLIYWQSGTDVAILNGAQFALMAPGFLLMLLAARSLFSTRQSSPSHALAGMAIWKMSCMLVMALSDLGLLGLLAYTSFRKVGKLPALLFGLATICMLMMSGMASAPQSVLFQWIEESINTTGQISFALGSWLLSKRI